MALLGKWPNPSVVGACMVAMVTLRLPTEHTTGGIHVQWTSGMVSMAYTPMTLNPK